MSIENYHSYSIAYAALDFKGDAEQWISIDVFQCFLFEI